MNARIFLRLDSAFPLPLVVFLSLPADFHQSVSDKAISSAKTAS
ncbi:hypothetical protein VCRA2126O84_270028 [Vibrio crassostreae]|nr:hypothetical protein VCRA2126O84_270028 [Vibrio crassostreae]